MHISYLLILPILLPVLSGLLAGFCRPAQKPARLRFFLIAAPALSAAAVLALSLIPETRLVVFRFTDRLPLLFRNDGPALAFCGLSSLIFLLIGVYCPAYMQYEAAESRFAMFYLLVLGMLMGLGFSGNLFTLYLFLEGMTLCAIPLVLHSMKREAIAAAFQYLYYSIAGATLGLLGFFFIYQYGTSLEFTAGGVLDMQILSGHEEGLLFVIMLAIIGFGAKAGMFPLHAWLPAAHPVAPAPASAVLSGVVAKAGVFAVIRFVFYLVGPDFIRGTWVQSAWISLTLFTVLMGSLLAFREPVLKRRLAYSSVSQISYILFGLALLTADGVTGALLHIFVHSVVKSALFLAAGMISLVTQKTNVLGLRGAGKQLPVTMTCFTLLALAAAGVPPTGGFVSKWYLAAGALSSDMGFLSLLGPAVLMLSALLTAGYLLSIAVHAFFPGADFEGAGGNSAGYAGERSLSGALLIPVLLLTAAALISGLFPGALLSLSEKLAAGMF